MTKISLTSEEFQVQLQRQITLLKAHVVAFPSEPVVALDIATKVRVLCHDTKKQSSLLHQLGLKDKASFPDTFSLKSGNNTKAPFCGLVYVNLDWGGARFVPKLNNQPEGADSPGVPFDQWWNTCILRDYNGRELTREALILEMAETDGGAHVDKSLKETYHFISRQHSLTWKFRKNKQPEVAVSGVELASVCQIGYEVAVALDPAFSPPRPEVNGMLGEFAVHGSPGEAMFGRPLPYRMEMFGDTPKGSSRNELCKCGSGVKAKKCCPDGVTVIVQTNPV